MNEMHIFFFIFHVEFENMDDENSKFKKKPNNPCKNEKRRKDKRRKLEKQILKKSVFI